MLSCTANITNFSCLVNSLISFSIQFTNFNDRNTNNLLVDPLKKIPLITTVKEARVE